MQDPNQALKFQKDKENQKYSYRFTATYNLNFIATTASAYQLNEVILAQLIKITQLN